MNKVEALDKVDFFSTIGANIGSTSTSIRDELRKLGPPFFSIILFLLFQMML